MDIEGNNELENFEENAYISLGAEGLDSYVSQPNNDIN